jgi:hypothetical protein
LVRLPLLQKPVQGNCLGSAGNRFINVEAVAGVTHASRG